MCAVTAAQRGHTVTLYEKSGRIGGRLNPGSVPKIKFDVANYLDYLKDLCLRTVRDYDLDIKLNTEATPALFKAEGFDKIVVAIGTKDCIFNLPGVEGANLCLAVELLDNPALAKDARKAVVIGGGVVGCETAYFLNKELGLEVTVVEMTQYFMNHVCTANRGYMLKYMYDAGIRLLNCTKLIAFGGGGAAGNGGVKVLRNRSKTVPDPYLSWNPILPENILNPLAPKIKDDLFENFHPAAPCCIAGGGASPGSKLLFRSSQKVEPRRRFTNIGRQLQAASLEATKAGYSAADL